MSAGSAVRAMVDYSAFVEAGNLRARVWKSPNEDGSGGRELDASLNISLQPFSMKYTFVGPVEIGDEWIFVPAPFEELFAAMERAFIAATGCKPPGSNRTRRLRKKRHKALFERVQIVPADSPVPPPAP